MFYFNKRLIQNIVNEVSHCLLFLHFLLNQQIFFVFFNFSLYQVSWCLDLVISVNYKWNTDIIGGPPLTCGQQCARAFFEDNIG